MSSTQHEINTISAFSVFLSPSLLHEVYAFFLKNYDGTEYLLFPSNERGNHLTVIFNAMEDNAKKAIHHFDEHFLQKNLLMYSSDENILRDYFRPFEKNSIRVTCNYDRIILSSIQGTSRVALSIVKEYQLYFQESILNKNPYFFAENAILNIVDLLNSFLKYQPFDQRRVIINALRKILSIPYDASIPVIRDTITLIHPYIEQVDEYLKQSNSLPPGTGGKISQLDSMEETTGVFLLINASVNMKSDLTPLVMLEQIYTD